MSGRSKFKNCVGFKDPDTRETQYQGLNPVIRTQKTIKRRFNLNCNDKLLKGFLEIITQSPVQYLFYHFYTYFSYLYIFYLLRSNRKLDVENDLSDILLSSRTIQEKKERLEKNDRLKRLDNKILKLNIIDVACMEDKKIQDNLKEILSFIDFTTYSSIYNYFCNQHFQSICNHFNIPKLENTSSDKGMTYVILVFLIIFTFKYKDDNFDIPNKTEQIMNGDGRNQFLTKIESLMDEYKFYEKFPGSQLTKDEQRTLIKMYISLLFYYKFPPARINGERTFIGQSVDLTPVNGDGSALPVVPGADCPFGNVIDFSSNRPAFIDLKGNRYYYWASHEDGAVTFGRWFISTTRRFDANGRFRIYFKFCQGEESCYYHVLYITPGIAAPVRTDYTLYNFAYDKNSHEWGWWQDVNTNGEPVSGRLSVIVGEKEYFYKYHNYWGWFTSDNKPLTEGGSFQYKTDSNHSSEDNIRLEPRGENLITQPRYVTIPSKFRCLLVFATIIEFIKTKKVIIEKGNPPSLPGNSTVTIRTIDCNNYYSQNTVTIADHYNDDQLREQWPLLYQYREIVDTCVSLETPVAYDEITKTIIEFIRKNSVTTLNYSLNRR